MVDFNATCLSPESALIGWWMRWCQIQKQLSTGEAISAGPRWTEKAALTDADFNDQLDLGQ
jgi:hypothetical protein